MAGTIWLNVIIAGLAFVITLITALVGNTLSVSLQRAALAFALFFLAGFVVRWAIRMIVGEAGEEKGSHVDLLTPPDGDDRHARQESSDPSEQFTPLVPPRAERKQAEYDPANIADAVRRLSDE